MKRAQFVLVALLVALGASAQTRIQPGQIGERPTPGYPPPETETFFAEEEQLVFFLAPGTNREVVKVEVYRNGLIQTDIGNARVQPDYGVSADKREITFNADCEACKPRLDDIIRVLYWLKP